MGWSKVGRDLCNATLALAYALGARQAAATQTGSEHSYQVAVGCPDRAEWAAALRARLPERLHAAAERRGFRIEIEREPAVNGASSAHYTGRLGSASDPVGEGRSVTGASCRDVAEALTLIAALELQQSAPASDARSAVAQSDTQDRALDASPRAESQREPDALRVSAIGFALVQSVTTSRRSTDFGAGVSLSWQTDALQPWLMLGVYLGDEAVGLPGGAGSAHFERWAAHVVGCPLRFPREARVAIRPCVDLDFGRLTGEGRGVRLARDSSSWLASAGAGLRFEWAVVDRLVLGAQAGGVLALSRPRFFFAPDFTALEVPALGLRAGASASLTF